MANIVLSGVAKVFNGKTAVERLDLEIEDGEFLIIVGPSGCGKTTTLRMLAGFETPSHGVIRIGGRVVNNVAPKDRDIAMVFQNYALFPHMTVEKNLAFGMKVRHENKATIVRQVREIAEMLGIDPLLGRRPAELSGGERQRVALGRALLRKPQAFLLDEPLSNLDAALRAQMRFELKRIHAQFPVTTVYVTHDQVEAMTMADRIALMHSGRLQQVATPDVLYSEPANSFVAGFVGSPKINLVPGTVKKGGPSPVLQLLGAQVPVDGALAVALESLDHGNVIVGLRPEEIKPCDAMSSAPAKITAIAEVIEPLGSETHIAMRVGEDVVMARFPPRCGIEVGSEVNLELNVQQMKVFDGMTGERLA